MYGHTSSLCALLVMLAFLASGQSQPGLSGAAATQLALERLNVLGSALMIAAHPDDEDTALLAWLSRGRKVRTAYLSLTRGEGGQNLIGPEQGALLGAIRAQELLAARRIDGAEQFFTRAVDFGYSKSADEAMEKWGREQVLGDIVRVIRGFRPDVIILRFSGTPRDGHGQHQASAILGKEAFHAAADPRRFPELPAWKAKRLVTTSATTGGIEVDVGKYDPVLGYSYTEIAGQSRSMHQSQGMGTAERRGSAKQRLAHVAGDAAAVDLFEGVEMKWGGEAGVLLKQAVDSFDLRRPERTVPLLLKARPLVTIERKRRELDEAIALSAGLWLDAAAERPVATVGETVRVLMTALNRSRVEMKLASVSLEGATPMATLGKPLPENVGVQHTFNWQVAPEPVPHARLRLEIGGETIEIRRPVVYRYVDKVLGERTRPFAIVPQVSASFMQPSVLFPSRESRPVEIRLHSFAGISGQAELQLPAGWSAEPTRVPFSFKIAGKSAGSDSVIAFQVTPPATASLGEARLNGDLSGIQIIEYPHIPVQVVKTPATATLARVDVRTTAKTVGYIMGAGDLMPDALRQLGCEVTLLDLAHLGGGDLSRFDAIVAGVRAYNVREDLRANQRRLMEYVQNGGTFIVQYNVLDRGLDLGAPHSIKIGRGRVSVEEAPVSFVSATHHLLNQPNTITPADFEGWVQERGLYFAESWDAKYDSIIASADPGEKPHAGGLLYARVGKGVYIFTAYSWFRQLPAGVPGAYRIFANLLSAGRTK